MDKLKVQSGVAFPKVNVNILQKSTDGRILGQTVVSNRVLKHLGVYSYIRWITGAFNNDASIWDQKQYVPKFLAVGSNSAPEDGSVPNGAPGTTTAVKFSDISLYNELNDSDKTGEIVTHNRIKLNRANYISDNGEDNYLKVQYEAYIPEDRFVNETIGEMALMTLSTGYNAFARVTFEPFVKVKNTVVQVLWEISVISIESSNRYHPLVKQYLREAIEKGIDVLEKYITDPVGYNGAREKLNFMLQPATNKDTGLFYLLNDNNMLTQDIINNFLSKPFNNLDDTGLIPLINLFDPDWTLSEKE